MSTNYTPSPTDDRALACACAAVREINGLIACLKAYGSSVALYDASADTTADPAKAANTVSANTKALKIAKYTFSTRLKGIIDAVASLANLADAEFKEILWAANNCVSLVATMCLVVQTSMLVKDEVSGDKARVTPEGRAYLTERSRTVMSAVIDLGREVKSATASWIARRAKQPKDSQGKTTTAAAKNTATLEALAALHGELQLALAGMVIDRRSDVLIQGTLARLNRGLVSSWKPKFFVLSAGKLCCYEKEGDQKPSLTMAASALSDIIDADESETRRAHCFRVVARDGRALTLSAATADELRYWTWSLRDVITARSGDVAASGHAQQQLARFSFAELDSLLRMYEKEERVLLNATRAKYVSAMQSVGQRMTDLEGGGEKARTVRARPAEDVQLDALAKRDPDALLARVSGLPAGDFALAEAGAVAV